MASGSFDLTTYYAKRIIGDTNAASAATALLQAGVDDSMWIFGHNRNNYGIRYLYDSSTNGTADKIEFHGGHATNTTAWIQLDTGDASFGIIKNGTWQASIIAPAYGGTGVNSYAKGDILYAGAAIANTDTTALSKLALGTAGYTLQATANGPAWTQTVAVANGGTGKTSWTKGGIIYASATDTLTQIADGSADKVLRSTASATYSWLSYTSSSTASTIVYRDASKNFSAGTITASLSGNATSATKANITSNKYGISYYSDTAGTFATTAQGTSGYLLQAGGSSAAPSWIQATNANTASTIVKRDSSGNFSAGTITATLSGNATSASAIESLGRQTSTDITHIQNGGLQFFLVDGNTTTNKPAGDGFVLHAHWDGVASNAWDAQLYIPDGHSGHMQFRGHSNATTWGTSWITLLDSGNYTTYCTPANIGAATSEHNHDSTYLKLSGGTMTGSLKFSKDSPLTFVYTASTETPVLVLNNAVNCGIRYKEGTPDTLKLSASGNAQTDAGADLCINGNGDGTVTIRGNTILHMGNAWYAKTCSITSSNMSNYPWHRFAYCTTGTAQYQDRAAIIILNSRYRGGPYGIIKLEVRMNATGGSIDTSAKWIIRYGFSAGDVKISTTSNKVGTDTTISAYVKCPTYARRIAYMASGSNNGWTLVSSNEPADTTTSDKKGGTEINASVSGAEATDCGIVASAGSSASCTGNAATATSLQCGVTTNDIGSYGNVKVTTARGNYQGIFIGPSAANGFCLMNHKDGDYMGMYKEASPGAGWIYCYRPSLGKLGIMTSSPTETLHVAGNLIVAGTGSAREYLYIRSSGDYEADLTMGRQGANKWAFSVRKSSEAFFGLFNYNLTTPNWAVKVDDSTSNITTYGTYIKVYGSGDRYVEAVNTTTSCRICLDSGTTNHGIWSSGYWNGSAYTNSNLYMIYRNSSNQIVINRTHAVVEQQAVSYIAGAKGDAAGLLAKKTEGASAWYPAVCIQTKAAGSWQIGTYTSESLEFVYAAKADITNQTNDNAKHWYLTADSYGTILTTRNYSSYALPLSGGTMTGTLAIINNTQNNATYNALLYIEHKSANDWGIIVNKNDANDYGIQVKCTSTGSNGINCTGRITGTKVYGAVWNDYAEYRQGEITEGGYCVHECPDGTMRKSTERLEAGCRVTSDTFGFAIGETEKSKTPIAVSGRVLVYPYRDKKEYKLGDAVCSAPDGKVDIMSRNEIIMYPERIIGTVSEIPDYDIWECGEGKDDKLNHRPVNGRIWIYVR